MIKNYFITSLFAFLVFKTSAQSRTDKEAFRNAFIGIFENRANGFDSITLTNVIAGTPFEFDATIKFPGADKCFISDHKYRALYNFKDKTEAASFFKNMQDMLNYSVAPYKAKVLFIPYYKNQEYLWFYLTDSTGFMDAENLLFISEDTKAASEKRFVVNMQLDSKPNMSYYTSAGPKISNPAITSLIKDIGFGNDPKMTKIKKNKKTTGEGVVYESARTLRGYTAAVYDLSEEGIAQNVLQLETNWTGKEEQVYKKVDSLILQLKAALPASYCYTVNRAEQEINFRQQSFIKEESDAEFVIKYGINESPANSYYVALMIMRTIVTDEEMEDAEVEEVETKKDAVHPVTSQRSNKASPQAFKGENGKYGYKDGSGSIIVQPKYDKAESFREERALVVSNKKYGYVDMTGKEIIPLKYDYASLYFFDGIADVRLNNKYGMIDKTGREIVAIKYDRLDKGISVDKSNKFILAKLDNKFGFIDSSGREVVPLNYEDAKIISTLMATVKLNGKWGVINESGKAIVPLIYDYIDADEFKKTGYLRPRLNMKYGLIDKNGNTTIAVKYDQISIGFSENLARMEVNDKFGFVDKTGKEVILPKYENASDFSNGMAEVKMNGKWGFIDKTGKETIAFKYESTRQFTEGLAAVQLNGKWGFIDKTGMTVIPFKYDNAYEFDDGDAKVYIGKKWGRINKKGEVTTPINNEEEDDDDGW